MANNQPEPPLAVLMNSLFVCIGSTSNGQTYSSRGEALDAVPPALKNFARAHVCQACGKWHLVEANDGE